MIKNNPEYTCLVAFDLRNIDKAVKKIKTLSFTKKTNLDLYDGDRYDLVSSVNEEAKSDFRKVVIYKNNCYKTINGISVAYQNVDSAWESLYKKSMWGKFVIEKVKIHHVDDPEAEKY
jgi:hypothetical protein